MNVPLRLGLYGLGLVVAFGGALGAGALASPLLPESVTSGPVEDHTEPGESAEGDHGEPDDRSER
ncbi:hypothetical protein [Nocardiopsis halotolerans]|uniref:hypothetical protein n=1 Tax=Nocardiopsis halotolerans TaxID=124252 RepID=UPI00034C8C7A|nr:hypothetical protein [Nocardiopsis halotolerans]